MTTEHTCVGKIWDEHRHYSCGKKAKYEHEGKWYCKTHHPPTVQAKNDARNERWRKEWAEQRERSKQQEAQRAEQKRRADLYPELLEACIYLVQGIEACGLTGVYLNQARAAIAKATEGVQS